MEASRNKNVTKDDLQNIFSNLNILERQFIKESKLFLSIGMDDNEGGKLYKMDLFISGIVNRAISLIHGFLLLSQDDNYISAVPLIRVQLDNCLRFYASTITADFDDFFSNYLAGEHIRRLKDANGKKMTDAHLVRKLDENVLPGILKLYDNTSGYIHLSNEHIFLQSNIVEGKERTIGTRIGKYDFFEVDEKVDFAYNMFVVTNLLLTLISFWKDEKLRIESE